MKTRPIRECSLPLTSAIPTLTDSVARHGVEACKDRTWTAPSVSYSELGTIAALSAKQIQSNSNLEWLCTWDGADKDLRTFLTAWTSTKSAPTITAFLGRPAKPERFGPYLAES